MEVLDWLSSWFLFPPFPLPFEGLLPAPFPWLHRPVFLVLDARPFPFP
jgi:hypothetical protein